MSTYMDNDDGQYGFDVPGSSSSGGGYIEEVEGRGVTELYTRLKASDREYFQRVVRILLSGTYVLQMDYETETGLMSRNADYIFILANYDLLSLYFEMGGFNLVHDKDNGLFALENESDEARYHFNTNSTRIALALRCIYQKKYSDSITASQITSSVGETVRFLKDNLGVDISSNKQQMAADFKTLVHFNIIDKGKGEWKDPATVFRITPAILHLVSSAKVEELLMEVLEEEN
ncbi:DUF4194 domain-containing protein [Butyrivibrio sp. MC2013]|uniref:DUF4194 domain-containing protein n=1 Tax=Butyrivibrio sp. MC2013 TaxID=1280686 RepID=UPI00047B5808|nr:DUF4194 domain-containing protein [Butyrivibrio sp. MC2013]